jgi:hypothetical protein
MGTAGLVGRMQAQPSTLLKSDNEANNEGNCADQEWRQFRQ